MRYFKFIALSIILIQTSFLFAQNNSLNFEFGYDNNGNRVYRKVITLTKTELDSTKKNDTIFSISSTLDFANQKLGLKNISVYPNPTTDELKVWIEPFEKFERGDILINDLNGQKVYESKIFNQGSSIHLSSLANGIYFMTVLIDNQKIYWKIIKK